MDDFHTCRLCHEGDFHASVTMLRSGRGHWVHKTCYISSGRPLNNLSREQLLSLPALPLKRAGLLEQVERLIATGL